MSARIQHIDARYSKTYGTYDRAVKEAEGVWKKFDLTDSFVFICASGDNHDRFAPLFKLGPKDQWKMGGLWRNGYNITA